MMNVGLALLTAAVGLAALGIAGYVFARRSESRSRYAALTVFGHGSLASAGVLLGVMAIHLHSFTPFSVHLHSLDRALSEILACDLEVGCAALTIGLITVLMLLGAFAANQMSARLLLRRLRRASDRGATDRLRALVDGGDADLIAVDDPEPDAFAMALLRGDRRRLARAVSVVVVTRGLMDLLDRGELRAAVAHELAHVRAYDDRYLPFFRTLSSLLFFDPVLRVLQRRMSQRHEFEADREAATQTGRPLDLARALLKVYLRAHPTPRAAGFRGGSRSDLLARIEALLAMEPGGRAADLA